MAQVAEIVVRESTSRAHALLHCLRERAKEQGVEVGQAYEGRVIVNDFGNVDDVRGFLVDQAAECDPEWERDLEIT